MRHDSRRHKKGPASEAFSVKAHTAQGGDTQPKVGRLTLATNDFDVNAAVFSTASSCLVVSNWLCFAFA